jgi:hypothetical protein
VFLNTQLNLDLGANFISKFSGLILGQLNEVLGRADGSFNAQEFVLKILDTIYVNIDSVSGLEEINTEEFFKLMAKA